MIFLLLLTLLVLLARNILRLYADQRSRVLGSRLRSRMLLGALLLSFAPALFMFLFSYLLLNRSIDRWFSQPVGRLREDSSRIALELAHYAGENARAEAESLASSPTLAASYTASDAAALRHELRTRRITLQGGFALVFNDGELLASYQLPQSGSTVSVRAWPAVPSPAALPRGSGAPARTPAPTPFAPGITLPAAVLATARRSDESLLTIGATDYALGTAPISAAGDDLSGLVVVALPMPTGLSAVVEDVGADTAHYWTLYGQRRTVRSTYTLLLLLLTTLTFFASSWLALFLSKQVTRPVEALADAMDEIAAGHYRHRIHLTATEELGELIDSFNHMAADLDESRTRAEISAQQLSEANLALDERRRELELILETIPSGVVVLSTDGRILQLNRAFQELVAPELAGPLAGLPLAEVLPPELREEVPRLERRAQRMGLAGAELELHRPPSPAETNGSGAPSAPATALSLSVTIAVLRVGSERRGSVLVVEDATDVLLAQRQLAWKEVAQRVAHEIKNPLTPIGLSAERIRRHVDRPSPDSAAVMRRCTEVILNSVENLRTLVDRFGTLAEFPAAQPRPASLNTIVEGALALFQGRLDGIRIETRLAPALPAVLADPPALERAFANLIDNAAEAMRDSLLRVLTLETSLGDEPGTVEIAVADTGPGLADDIRERLFLPFNSSKHRGSGLGLVIVAKTIADHHGTIRAESRAPSGARFVIDLPAVAHTTNGHAPAAAEAAR